MAGLLVVIASVSGKLGPLKRVVWALAIVAVVWSAMHNERWQRYKELDTDSVEDRIAGSVNRTFWEVLVEYPMGNGLGGGGTSIPYFLASQVNRPVEVENDYCRILLEQGVVGLLLWIGFVVWFCHQSSHVRQRRMAERTPHGLVFVRPVLVDRHVGNGMLNSIPNSFLFLLCVGWTSVSPVRLPMRPRSKVAASQAITASVGAPSY